MNCHYCNETVTGTYHDTEGNIICRKCDSYSIICTKCGHKYYKDWITQGICEDCWNSGAYDEEEEEE